MFQIYIMLYNVKCLNMCVCMCDLVTRSQLLEGPKCESQTKNNVKAKSRGTLPGSQHQKGVEGRVRASRWDQEELTSFTYSHGPTQNRHEVVNAQLEHLWCQDEPCATRIYKTHHGPDLGEAATFPFIVFSAPLHGGHIQMTFCPEIPNFHNQDSCNFGAP